ncbi:MAG: DMT family transporter [Lentisphaerae bacterium]|nr:DMT family transporter [Lentisphaerota bacterium]
MPDSPPKTSYLAFPYISCFLAWFVWSFDPVIISLLGSSVPSLVISSTSLTMGGAFFLALSVRHFKKSLFTRRCIVLLVVYILFCTTFAQLAYITALKFLHPALVSMVLRSQIVLATLAAWALLKEKIGPKSILGIIVVIIAYLVGALLNQPGIEQGHDKAWLGWCLAAVAAILWTFGTIIGKTLLQTFNPNLLNGCRLLPAGLITLAAALLIEGPQAYAQLTTRHWVLLVIQGIGCTAFGFALFYYGLRAVKVAAAAAIEQFAPLFTLINAWIIQGTLPSTTEIVSLFAVLIGATIVATDNINNGR